MKWRKKTTWEIMILAVVFSLTLAVVERDLFRSPFDSFHLNLRGWTTCNWIRGMELTGHISPAISCFFHSASLLSIQSHYFHSSQCSVSASFIPMVVIVLIMHIRISIASSLSSRDLCAFVCFAKVRLVFFLSDLFSFNDYFNDSFGHLLFSFFLDHKMLPGKKP